MAMNGIGGALSGLGLPGLQPRPLREGEERKPATPDAAKAIVVQPKAPDADAVLSAEPPPGTDPAFWSVLTTEERLFFSKMQTLGPLTYGPASAPPKAALARGGRIDLKV
jgi:hypothetical protein